MGSTLVQAGRKVFGVTLAEVLVAAGLFSLILTAVISFFIEAGAVSAKRNQSSERLRRFHIGLDKIEQTLREARIVKVTPRSVLFLKLSDESESNGFPLYDEQPAQFVLVEKGLYLFQNGESRPVFPTESSEAVEFTWVHSEPEKQVKSPHRRGLLNVSFYLKGQGQRSDLFFHRTINLQTY